MSRFWAEREELGRRGFPPAPPHKLESLRGPGTSNVVLKGFAIAGAHPGSTTSEIVANLTPLLRAGITTFVCLQHELPRAGHGLAHQRSAYANTNVVTAKNYLPDAQAMIESGSFPQSAGSELSFLHLPITEANGATVADDILKQFILELISYMKAGEHLYIQCADGNGRTGTVAAVLMGLAFNLSSSEALDLSQRSRADRAGIFGLSPESHEQKMQVHRLLGDREFRARAASVGARRSNSSAADVVTQLDSTIKKIRAVFAKKGPVSLIYLRRYAQTLAPLASSSAGEPALDWAAFLKLAADAEWHLTPEESDSLWGGCNPVGTSSAARSVRSGASADVSHPGTISVNNLFGKLRGTMSARRAAAVHECFKRLSFNSAATTLEMLAAAFHPETHPDVRATRRTAADVKDEFYDTFGIASRDASMRRQVAVTEFENYYADMSAATSDDAYFELIVFGCWPAGQAPGAKPTGRTMAGRVAASTAELTAAPKVYTPTVLVDAYLQASGAIPSGSIVAKTQHGYSYTNINDPEKLVPAMRQFLKSKTDFTVSLFGTTLRRNDSRRDGHVDLFEFRQALLDANAALPEIDSELAFLGLAAKVSGRPMDSIDVNKAALPIEAAHELLRQPLSDAKRALVLSTFNSFDREGAGAVPVATLVLAFKAEEYPAVAAGKISPHVVYKLFQDSFAEGFALVDKYGPAARSAGYGSPAALAYYGSGDGLVRFPFFEAFHEGLAAGFPEDNEFAHVVAHIWSGGRRAHKASLDPHTVARRAEVAEDGFMTNLERLSMNHPYQPNAASNSGGTALRSFAHKGDSVIGTSAPRPPQHAAVAAITSSSSGPSTPRQESDYERFSRSNGAEPRLPTTPSIYSGGDGFTGKVSSGMRSSPRYTTGHGAAPLEHADMPSSGSDEVDSLLATIRDVLFRRSTKGIFALIRLLEDASASYSPSRRGDIFAPIPASALAAVLRDASFGLSPRQLETLVGFVESKSRCGSRAVIPHVLLEVLRGRLSANREDIVKKAYAHVSRKSQRYPTLDDVRMMYRSVLHPDVVGRKREEESVLREFLETFDGPTFVDMSGNVSYEGFAEYFVNLSFYYDDDSHFAVLMFDTWGLSRESTPGYADIGAAGKPSTLQDAPPIGSRASSSPASAYGQKQRAGTLFLGETTSSSAARPYAR